VWRANRFHWNRNNMSLKRIYAIYIRQYYLIKGNPTRLASMFLWTVINILMWGFISRYLSTFGQATFSVVTVLLGAIILWDLTGRIQQGVMTAFLEDTWTHNFINFFDYSISGPAVHYTGSPPVAI